MVTPTTAGVSRRDVPGQRRRRWPVLWAGAAVVVAVACLVVWLVRPTRSVEAYCKTFFARGTEFRAVYQDPANQNFGWGQVSAVMSAPQRLSDVFAALDKVAPDDIEPDVASLKDGFAKVSDSMVANGTGGLVGMATALAQGIAMQPAWDRVNAWTTDKCGPPPKD